MNLLNIKNFISIYFLSLLISGILSFEDSRKNVLELYNRFNAEELLGHRNSKLEITKGGFIRYKREKSDKSVEYYSFRLDKFKDVDFLGSENACLLVFKCEDSSIIFQTYGAKGGDIDEMENEVKIPLKNIPMDQMMDLRTNLMNLKQMFINTYK
nr:hypothetical protein [Pseudopedobacter sp.]